MDNTDSVRPASGNVSSGTSSSMPTAGATPMSRTNSQSSTHRPSSIYGHVNRHNFVENQRHPPPSPRASRHPSFTQQMLQELISHPHANRNPNPRYAGRDWRDIALEELAVPEEVRWARLDDSVENATKILLKSPNNVVLVRDGPAPEKAPSVVSVTEELSSENPPTEESEAGKSMLKVAVSTTFDYSDLNAYLLVVIGLAKPGPNQVALYDTISKRARAQEKVTLREIQPICQKEELVVLRAKDTLDKAIEAFGSGIHRILIANDTGEVVGLLSQLRLAEFFWHEAVNFPVIDRLFGSMLRDLGIGAQQVIAVNFDAPLTDALLLMHTECLTSVPVVDHTRTVVGNISTADVKHLASANNAWLLKNSCMTFISKILTERGVEHGRDSVPVFHVTPYSTLGHTVAKLVATRSHRMWVIESASPSPSMPTTPLLGPTHSVSSSVLSSSPAGTVVIPPPTPPPLSSPPSAPLSAPLSSSPLPTQTTFNPAVVSGSRMDCALPTQLSSAPGGGGAPALQ
ncbi:uncharacterized protein CTHT_0048910 [Thermochaetoides thermophila DSM 1495]|uniref:CBS domain-containing protein n=1 Tax=Chaetomium thermophilum (strain DSM 1495 / CBS 144.50 / IMI 039719) TaxID=759272 RepID=G0SB51_CHATD|nr:hypothetical protein CTHT_0048910 [Thermochaetoides thermophila DSM 1495]EGS19431.1 hypothetical protein CTHT_0048910 [Thermochaetoides thermophila DSM 1495]